MTFSLTHLHVPTGAAQCYLTRSKLLDVGRAVVAASTGQQLPNRQPCQNDKWQRSGVRSLISRRLLATSASTCPYKTLGISETSDAKTIKQAYLSKVMELHPDKLATRPGGAPKPGSPEHTKAKAQFHQIVKSYELLSDPKRRKEYDMLKSMGATSGMPDDQGKYQSSHRGFNWATDPRWRQSAWQYRNGKWENRSGSAGSWQQDYEFYYGPMNSGPLYMPNWQMAVLIIGAVVIGLGFSMTYFGIQRRRYMRALDARDEQLQEFYERRREAARERARLKGNDRTAPIEYSFPLSTTKVPKEPSIPPNPPDHNQIS